MKSPDVDENMVLLDVPCGHFALGTFSKTYLKDTVFEINDLPKKTMKNATSQISKLS